MIAADPTCGAVIEGSGGARKARLAVRNKGKSGGVRVVYAYHSGKFPAFLLAVFAKKERSTLSKAETNVPAKVIKAIFGEYGEKAFDKIMAGAEAALAYSRGDKIGSVTHEIEIIDVVALRKSMSLSQAQFAARFGLDKNAVVEWEHGRRRPDRSARILLRVIAKHPEAVVDALAG